MNIICFACVALAATASPGVAQPETARGITVIAVGSPSAGVVDAVKTQLSKSLWLPVHMKSVPQLVGANMEQLTAAAAAMVLPGDICGICLSDDAKWPRLHVAGAKHLALLCSTAYKIGPLDPPIPGLSDEERWMRRVKKEAVHAVCTLIGLQDCAFPRCCLLNHKNDIELDAKSCGPCPPCSEKAYKALKGMGVRLTGPAPTIKP